MFCLKNGWASRVVCVALAGMVVATPMPGHASAPGPVAPGVEGPAPASALDEAWLRRDGQLRTATLATLGISGASAIGLAAAGGVLASHGQHANDGSPEARALGGAGIVFGAAALALAVSGVLWQDHRYRRPASLEPRPETLAVDDPRRDPSWVRRDRGLTRGMIGTGVVLGGALAGLGVCLGLAFRPCEGEACEGPPGPVLGAITTGAIAGAMLLPFTLLAIARGVHRRPLRKARASVTGGGLRVVF